MKSILSDNATNFTGARKEMMAAFGDRRLVDRMTEDGITWEFNPPHSSHFGGVWERMIRTVRRVLESLMGNRQIDHDSLNTSCEVESIVNSRLLKGAGSAALV